MRRDSYLLRWRWEGLAEAAAAAAKEDGVALSTWLRRAVLAYAETPADERKRERRAAA